MYRMVMVAALLLALQLGSVAQPAYADGSWLDQPLSAWNVPGWGVPNSNEFGEFFVDEQCLLGTRPAETSMDGELAAAGWHLIGTYKAGWGITVVTATLGFDGMCRAAGFNQFVFVDAVYAGTVSPVLMFARDDGVGGIGDFYGPSVLTATFQRYAPDDALCCPTGGTQDVSYYVEYTEFGPVLLPYTS